MKTKLLLLFCLAFLQNAMGQTATDTILKIEANPKIGFNFAYYLWVPKPINNISKQFLLVETNNTGVNDTLAVHDAEALLELQTHSLGSSVARKLRLPFLVPVFPRPKKYENLYTHAFDRDAALLKSGEMYRLDLQLIAMIENAKAELKKYGWQVNEKILMNGFSASGTFANRFTMIHPNLVAAVACGGINAIPVLPVKAIGKTKLEYPLGLSDFEAVFHSKFDIETYKKVPQYLYMGAKDTNDAVLFDDAYSKKERKAVFNSIGQKMLPNRWNTCQSIYEASQINAKFVVYPNIGHQTDREVFNDVVGFFENIMRQ